MIKPFRLKDTATRFLVSVILLVSLSRSAVMP